MNQRVVGIELAIGVHGERRRDRREREHPQLLMRRAMMG
jgi:hypothetical protein